MRRGEEGEEGRKRGEEGRTILSFIHGVDINRNSNTAVVKPWNFTSKLHTYNSYMYM